jgi:iron-sulfur cluster assembly accessory protein
VISVTPSAAAEIRAALDHKGLAGFCLRVQIVGGGCEGFLYDLLYTDGPDREDVELESNGVRVVIARKLLPILEGLTIDHSKTSYGPGFVFENPAARSKCSCGASFST